MDEALEFFYTSDELGKYILLKQNLKKPNLFSSAAY